MRLGFLTGSGIVGAALVPLAVAVTAITSSGQIFSSGPLNAVAGRAPIAGARSHADLECRDCHVPFWSPEHMGDRCLGCHTDVAGEISTPNTLHGNLASPANCRQCHPEHRGPGAALTIYAPNLYPHAEFGFYLIAHLRHRDGRPFACQDCHVDQAKPFAASTCAECHLGLDHARMEAHQADFGPVGSPLAGCRVVQFENEIRSFGNQFGGAADIEILRA